MMESTIVVTVAYLIISYVFLACNNDAINIKFSSNSIYTKF